MIVKDSIATLAEPQLAAHIDFDSAAERWYIRDTNLPGLRKEAGTIKEILSFIVANARWLMETNVSDEQRSDKIEVVNIRTGESQHLSVR
ncbi:MAG: hypothetical protein R3C51_11335 [Parvularculaceae bacterium]